MKGGKAGKGGESRKRPPARSGEPSGVRTGPKRGEKKREWGAFNSADDIPPPVPPKGGKPRKP